MAMNCIQFQAGLSLPEYAAAVGIDQNRNHQLRVIGVLAFPAIGLLNASGIQLLEQFAVEKAFMILRKGVKHTAGK
ncbi:hypothetical protein GO003_014255 [Methylicorpusculum oleiharenae]|uniref:hypothetical protein n=1 Tax=Methylicorpusculum oleiharenae TaxID=1338687 RepID=UPI001357491B|nr:hypothetical protein [Methylicorpusculum oleiharenae]MCD2451553.1 hypothetical protein [Methylicorpusculum oleiharenae]